MVDAIPQGKWTLNDVSVIVLSHNREEELRHNLPRLCEASRTCGFELIIVDNASTDGSRIFLQELKSAFEDLTILLNEENKGVGEGRNTGARVAQRDFLLFLDDDARIEIPDIVGLRNILADRPDVGVVSPRILHAQTGVAQNDHGNEECEVGNYHGACHMVSGRARKIVGDIDILCSFGGEELDCSIRMRANGFTVLYAPQFLVYHNNFVRDRSADMARRGLRVYNFTRIHFKHFPWYTAAVFSSRHLFSHLLSGSSRHNLRFIVSLPFDAIRGAAQGRRQHQPLPRPVVAYYSNSSVRPDLGNVPLSYKLLRRLRAGAS